MVHIEHSKLTVGGSIIMLVGRLRFIRNARHIIYRRESIINVRLVLCGEVAVSHQVVARGSQCIRSAISLGSSFDLNANTTSARGVRVRVCSFVCCVCSSLLVAIAGEY